MNLDREADQVDQIEKDRDESIKRSLAILMRENVRLKKLVVQLSQTVVRNVVGK